MTTKSEHCNWSQDGDETSDAWATDCGRMFRLDDGDPFDNQMRHCCYCGKPLSIQAFLEPDEDGSLELEEPRFFDSASV